MKQVALPSLKRNKPLKELCTLEIGGAASYYMPVSSPEELREALLFCKENGLPFFILGKGSNSLFDDLGFAGCIIHNKIHHYSHDGNGTFTAGAGYSFSRLGMQTAKEGWSGLEFASGIPASVGGAVYMNAGANGSETKDCFVSVDFMDPEGEITTYTKNELPFAYRFSPFQTMKGAILSATFTLIPSEAARQKQLEIIHYRQKTQPYGEKSAGCVFRNPQGQSAGALIDSCGLKGTSCEGAEVSTLHANFLINKHEASASAFKKLICLVAEKVKQETGVELEQEIRMIPYDLPS
jgi:UDP-N-acetylmuramate dehydrogenase